MNSRVAGVAILISNKLDFKPKFVIRDEESHCIMIERSTQQEDLTIVNIYAPQLGSTQIYKQINNKHEEGHLGGSVVEYLPLAQAMVPESWDQVPHQGPLREPASPSTYVSAFLCLSHG